jgi:hypothetical protein
MKLIHSRRDQIPMTFSPGSSRRYLSEIRVKE